MAVRAVLLAAGRSVRMGRDKTTLRLPGETMAETLIERHVRQLRMTGIEDVIAICNPDNQAAIGVRTILQRGERMSGAVLTGLQACAGFDGCWLVCVNDIVADTDYRRISSYPLDSNEIAIATHTLDRAFQGGMLHLDPASGRIASIVEKPPGGCPPGSPANVMIHRLQGASIIEMLAGELASGIDYESAVNRLIAQGVRALAVPMDSWIAIKTPEDYERARNTDLIVAAR
jgi:NDP-sugar pyrophosphorylase family protein